MVKSTGIVRKVDALGRIVLPMELKKTLGISVNDQMEIYVEDDKIILKKYMPNCIFCSNTENLISYKDINICSECLREIKENIV